MENIIGTDVLLYDDGREYDLGRAVRKTVFLKVLTKDEAINAFQNGKRVYFIYENNRIYDTNCRKVCKCLGYLKDHYDFYHEVCGVAIKNNKVDNQTWLKHATKKFQSCRFNCRDSKCSLDGYPVLDCPSCTSYMKKKEA